MSDYDLSLTGAQIDAALNKVHNVDATPVDGSANMVTSDGVHDAVNNIQFTNLNSNLVSTDLSTGNNNTTIPTTQAVANLLTSGNTTLQYAICTGPSISISNQFQNKVYDSTWTITGTLSVSQSSGFLTVPSGVYMVREKWRAQIMSGSNDYDFYIRLRSGTSGNEVNIANHEATLGGFTTIYETNDSTGHISINNDVRTENVYSYKIHNIKYFEPTLQFIKIG
jgi:hypothetical protein